LIKRRKGEDDDVENPTRIKSQNQILRVAGHDNFLQLTFLGGKTTRGCVAPGASGGVERLYYTWRFASPRERERKRCIYRVATHEYAERRWY
jgi:hypothetical protein